MEKNLKTKMMCEALARAEKARSLPRIEGELPDMPTGEEDEDFEDFEDTEDTEVADDADDTDDAIDVNLVRFT